jgi:hypothetical protein
MNGHSHPASSFYLHYDGLLEVNSIALKDNLGFAIITLDREQMIHQDFHINDKVFALLIYPVPKRLVSKRTRFNVQKDEIRVIVFTESKNVNIRVSGNVTGKMKFNRVLRANLSLYTIPFDLPRGEHHVEFSGDWKYSLTFVINDSVKLDLERVPDVWHIDETRAKTFYVYWICLFIATVPIISFRIGDRVNEWVNGNDENEHIWSVVSFFIAPITLRSRLARLPASIQYFLFALTLAPLFVPAMFSYLNDQLYIVFWAGYMDNWRYSFDWDGQWFALVYLGWVVLPVINAYGHATLKWTKSMAVDWGYMLWGIFPTHNLISSKGGLNGRIAVYTSPLMVVVPQIIWIFTFCYKYRERNRLNSEN